MNISSIILAKNVEIKIKDCLKFLSWSDEIIVIDDNSNDKTAEIAKSLGAKVFTHSLNDDYSKHRNFGLSKAKNEWVLFVDADERVSISLRDEIKYQISNIKYSNVNGFYIKRTDFLWGRELKHGETGNIKLLRLAKKSLGIWDGKVHEKWNIRGQTSELKNPLLHYPHQDVSEFLRKVNFYTSLRAEELHSKKIKTGFMSIILYPLAKFIKNYFFKLGFLDGIPGLIHALMMGFHSFLVRGKLWLLWQKK